MNLYVSVADHADEVNDHILSVYSQWSAKGYDNEHVSVMQLVYLTHVFAWKTGFFLTRHGEGF